MMLLDVGTPMGQLKIFDVNIPIDEETTLVKFVALRTFFKGKWADRDARRRVFKVLYEDQAVVDEVRPELLPFDLSDELHVKSDINAVLYRRRRQELIEAGWGVEGNTIVGEGPARVEARVIPSPIRKEVPELASAWNFKEVRSREIQAGNAERASARRRAPHRHACPSSDPRPSRRSRHDQPVRNPVPRHARHHRRARQPHRGHRPPTAARSSSSTSRGLRPGRRGPGLPRRPDRQGRVRRPRGPGDRPRQPHGLRVQPGRRARSRTSRWTRCSARGPTPSTST